MKREYSNILEQNTKISFNEKFLHSFETSDEKEKKKTKYPSICLRCHYNCSDSSSNWLKIVQYLDILSFVVITVYVFTFSGLKATITFLLEISSLFDAFMQPKMNTTITRWQKDMNYMNSSFMFEWKITYCLRQ